MLRCHYTSLGLRDEDAQVLDLGAAHGLLRRTRKQLASLERLVTELSEADRQEVRGRDGTARLAWRKRVVSDDVAAAFQALAPGEPLFTPYLTWRARRAAKNGKASATAAAALGTDTSEAASTVADEAAFADSGDAP